MNTEGAFIKAIQKNPEDDDVRLVFADWLEEQGDPRGEFIRVQCALAGLDHRDSQYRELKERESRLLEQHSAALFVGSLGEMERYDIEFQRGFVHAITLAARDFVDKAARLFWDAPLLDTIRITGGWRRGFAKLIDSPMLKRVRNLDLEGIEVGNAPARMVAASPHVAYLSGLIFGRNIGNDGARAIASSKYLRRLKTLSMEWNRIGPSGAAALASSPNLTRLEYLNLNLGKVRSEGAASLAGMGHLTGLELHNNFIGDMGAAAIASSAHRTTLKYLVLSANEIADAGASTLASSPRLAGLTEFSLRFNNIGPDGVEALAQSPYFANLRVLDLGYNRMGMRGALALASTSKLSNIRSLSVERNRLHPRARKALRDRFGKCVHGAD